MQSILSLPTSDTELTPQRLVYPYPLVHIHHWCAMAQQSVSRMKSYLEGCTGPTPEAEALRQTSLDVLRDCAQQMGLDLGPDLAQALADEYARLEAACEA